MKKLLLKQRLYHEVRLDLVAVILVLAFTGVFLFAVEFHRPVLAIAGSLGAAATGIIRLIYNTTYHA